MTKLNVCRICLNRSGLMNNTSDCNKINLKICYEEVINSKVSTSDETLILCFECAALVQKFYEFKKKCYRALQALNQLETGSIKCNVSLIEKQRLTYNLKSSLQLPSYFNNRVKTFEYKYKTEQLQPVDLGTEILIQENVNNNKNPISDKELIKSNSKITDCTNSDDIDDINYEDHNIDEQESHIIKTDESWDTNKTKFKSVDKNMEKFKRSIKKKFLNPNHWNKLHLTEEDVEKEFKLKANDEKYLKAAYKCSLCFRVFSTEDMLNRHMKINHCESLGPFECRFCHFRMKWKSRLQAHLKGHYIRYQCLRCELSFPVETTAFRHDAFHNGDIKTCPHCREQFRHPSSFYTHLRKHKSKHVCTICGTSFISEFGLYMHKKVKHILINAESKIEQSIHCDVCNIKFETRSGYEEHLAESAIHNTISSEGNEPQPLKRRYTQRRAPRIYTNCGICNKNFSTYVAYSKHHLSEHSKAPLKLNANRKSIKKICEICGASVAPVSLAAHINTHTKEKRHTCTICGTQLSSKSGLNRHILAHTGEKPNKCSICDKRFAQTTQMKLHYRTVHQKEII